MIGRLRRISIAADEVSKGEPDPLALRLSDQSLAGRKDMTKAFLAPGGIVLALALGLSACTNSYDPGQRAVGGGLIGQGPVSRSELQPAAVPAQPLELHPVARLARSRAW
jgi:hypothetical protein